MTNKNELIVALVAAQLEMNPPKKDKTNPQFKSKYCSLDSVYEACRLPLAKNGLSISHSVEVTENKYSLRTTLFHISGAEINTVMPILVDKPTSQGFASALTYARKYAVCSLLALPTEEDDDGNEATTPSIKAPALCITFAQVKELEILIADDSELLERVLANHKAKSLSGILASDFKTLATLLARRG